MNDTTVEPLSPPPDQDDPRNFLVVGIGASAGGIPALQAFFEQVPSDSGMAYVVILHLSPDHDSKLAHVLQGSCSMPVTKVTERVRVERDHVYVVPPDQHLTIADEHICVAQNTTMQDRRAPVDIFFRALAESHRSRAVCVVLSGTGANGSMGLKRVKERGGAAFVQDPAEAAFDEMPRNSIATALVDDVLPVAEIPAKILAYKANLGKIEIPGDPQLRPEEQQQALREIFTLLRLRTGHDFSNYKRPTLLRRIERRINVHALPDLPSYAEFVRENPDETQALLKDLLISVTNFFRDAEAFEYLNADILPRLLKDKQAHDQVRIWVIGCATGEEAYSLAMLCAEHAAGAIDSPKIQIFATDIDATAIEQARDGLYTVSDTADVSPERLSRFFTGEHGEYQVRREIREMVLFAQHNVLKDPPFSHLDLITCRNVLIYLDDTAQQRVLESAHFALNPGGFLFLGSSESIERASELYTAVSRNHHVYQARTATTTRHYPLPESIPSFHERLRAALTAPAVPPATARMTFSELHQQLLERYAPPSLIVNDEYDVVHVSESAGRYLQVPGGEPSNNIFKLIREELRLEVRTALYQASQRKTNVEAPALQVTIDNRTETINIHVRPVASATDPERGYALVVFEPATQKPSDEERVYTSDEPVARQLEKELMRLKTQLRSSNEQHEIQAEELKASNEELHAVNEELRSAAEELETGREELQSINEELTTVNQELNVKIEEVSQTSNNLQNLINSTDIATIFLDRGFRVNLFSPAARGLFNLLSGDVRRKISDITTRLESVDLAEAAAEVLQKLRSTEREVRTTDGRSYLMRLSPYRTADDRIQGVVATFTDITERKRNEEALAADLRDTTLLRDLSARLVPEGDPRALYNEIMRAAVALTHADAGTVQILDGETGELVLIASQGFSLEVRERFRRVDVGSNTPCGEALAKRARTFMDFDGPETSDPDGAMRLHREAGYLSAQSTPLVSRGGKVIGMVTTHWCAKHRPAERELRFLDLLLRQAADLLEQRQMLDALRESESRFRTLVQNVRDYAIFMIDPQGVVTEWTEGAERVKGYTSEEAIGRHLSIFYAPEELAAGQVQKELATAAQTGRSEVEGWRVRKSGERFVVNEIATAIYDADGNVTGFTKISRDITDRKLAEERLRESDERLKKAMEIETVGVLFVDNGGNVLEASDAFLQKIGYSREAFDKNGLRAVEFTPPEWRARAMQATQELETRALATPYEQQLMRADGSRFWGLVAGARLGENESVLYVIDLTASKQADAAYHASEERLRLMLESVLDYAIFTMDEKGIIDSWAPGAQRTFGYTDEDAIGQHTRIIFTPEDRAARADEREMQTARERGRAADERWHIRKDGTRFYVSGVLVPLQDSGVVTGYAKIARDLTQQKQTQDELRRAHEDLETRVEERTHELAAANESLRREVFERQRVEDARVFLLRQLVNAQEGERRRISRELHDQLGQQVSALGLKLSMLKNNGELSVPVRGELQQLESLVKDLDSDLDFLVWELRPTALDDLGLVDAVSDYAATWSRHFDVPVNLHAPDEVRETRLEPEIETVLYRMTQEALNNVAKHAHASAVQITLSRRADEVSLTIVDDGVGFDDKQPFGTGAKGLGLVGMRERAALAGGSVNIESKPGAGTTVRLVIPARPRGHAADHAGAADTAKGAIPRRPRGAGADG
jgi:two-component system CheB/CheR fusion protein